MIGTVFTLYAAHDGLPSPRLGEAIDAAAREAGVDAYTWHAAIGAETDGPTEPTVVIAVLVHGSAPEHGGRPRVHRMARALGDLLNQERVLVTEAEVRYDVLDV